MKKIAFLLICASCILSGQGQIDLKWLSEQPKSYARDLFLERLVQQTKLDENDSSRAFFLTHSPKNSHIKAFAAKNKSESLKALWACQGAAVHTWLMVEPECADLGFSFEKLSSAMMESAVEPEFIQKLSVHIARSNEQKARFILILNSPDVFSQTINSSEAFEYIFSNSKPIFRQTYLNKPIPKGFLKDISSQKFMTKLAKTSLLDSNLSAIRESLLLAKPSECVCDARFWLGLSALGLGQNDVATTFFDASLSCASNIQGENRALFWKYLASGDALALQAVAKSSSTDIYAVYAKEHYGIPIPKVKTQIVSQDGETANDDFEYANPFEWLKLRSTIKKSSRQQLYTLQKRFASKKLEPFALQIAQKLGDRESVYLMPYEEQLKNETPQNRALYLSIARAESEFVPSVVSSAYAVGVMQLIPLLAGELAQKKHEKLDFFELFKPEKNIPYAITHFKWLQEKVKEPLFVAYSYNAGYGFFQRKVAGAGLFGYEDNVTKKYEPFWSMETIPYDETRIYGKKVLSNYIAYSNAMDLNVTAHRLLEKLTQPVRR